MNLLDTIKNKKDFSLSEEKVKKVIVENPGIVEEATITFLANMADTSTSAVLRFVQSLGYSGYKEFKYAFMNEFHTDNDVMNEYSKCLSNIPSISKNKLIQALKESEMVFIHGQYYSSLPAIKLGYLLDDHHIHHRVFTDQVSLIHALYDNPTLITFSVSGNIKTYKGIIDYYNQKTIPNSYLITCHKKNALSKYYEHTIYIPSTINLNNKHISETLMMNFIDELITEI